MLEIKWLFGYLIMILNLMLLKIILCVWCGLIFIVLVFYYINVIKGLLKILKYCWGLYCVWFWLYNVIFVLLFIWEIDKKDKLFLWVVFFLKVYKDFFR